MWMEVDGSVWNQLWLGKTLFGKKNMSYYGDQWYSMVLLLRFFEGRRGFSRSRIRGILKHSLEAALCESEYHNISRHFNIYNTGVKSDEVAWPRADY